MRLLLADDEPALLDYLQKLIEQNWPQAEIVATAQNGEQALAAIQRLQPDGVFLDIAMPGMSGLEVAQKITYPCHIVFVTAFDHYAVEAFEKNALDYLLKPVEQKRLQQTIARIESRQQAQQINQVVEQLLQQQPKPALQWLKVQKGEEIRLLDINEVDYFQSADKYTSVFSQHQEYLLRTSLKTLEQQLDSAQFWRIHRSCIVRVKAIKKVSKDLNGHFLIELNGYKRVLPVSRSQSYLFK